MYYLKDVLGTKTRFESKKELFDFYENWLIKNLYASTLSNLNLLGNFDTLFLGKGFHSKAKEGSNKYIPFLRGAEDKRNENANLFSSGYFFATDRNLKLVTKNYFVLTDDKGRVIDPKAIKDDYECRVFAKGHYSKNDSSPRARSGAKSHSTRYRGCEYRKPKLCKEALSGDFGKNENPKIRSKTSRVARMLNEWEYDVIRNNSKNWKSQSKKTKQWMA